jgi:hypothetical protein
VARDLRVGDVAALVLQERGQRGLRFAPLACGFLLLALGFDALVLLLLRADRVRLGEVDVLARARLAVRGPRIRMRLLAVLRTTLRRLAARGFAVRRLALPGLSPCAGLGLPCWGVCLGRSGFARA